MAVVATLSLGSDTYSVYGLTTDALGDANTYFKARLGESAWDTVDNTEKRRSLITAVRMIDRRPTYSGDKTVSAQALEWPRDSANCSGDAVPDNTIPDNIALGEFELALALLEDESIQDSQSTGSNIKRAKAGSAEVSFFVPTINSTNQTLFPQVVHELISCYFDGSNSGLGAPFASGVDPAIDDQSTHFSTPCDEYNLTQGLP